MRIYDIIKRKRDGEELTEEEISFFTQSVTNGFASDEQTGAFLMAVYFNGMTRAETLALTNAMAKSGDSLDLSGWGRACADKHSSGGVGDKTTLAVAPLAACCGVTVAKMSGRGLGFTGGTVDKLESIPGFKTKLDEEEFARIAKKTGIAVVAQTKKPRALRQKALRRARPYRHGGQRSAHCFEHNEQKAGCRRAQHSA